MSSKKEKLVRHGEDATAVYVTVTMMLPMMHEEADDRRKDDDTDDELERKRDRIKKTYEDIFHFGVGNELITQGVQDVNYKIAVIASDVATAVSLKQKLRAALALMLVQGRLMTHQLIGGYFYSGSFQT